MRSSSKYRFSIGDALTISAPLYSGKGGTRLGTLYAHGAVAKGKTFRDAGIEVTGSSVLNDASQIAVQGFLTFANDATTFSVVGGSG